MVERRQFRHSEPLGGAGDADWRGALGAGDPQGRGPPDHRPPQDPLRPESQRVPAVVETSASTSPLGPTAALVPRDLVVDWRLVVWTGGPGLAATGLEPATCGFGDWLLSPLCPRIW